MPRKPKPQPEAFRFTEAIAMQILRVGFVEEVPRGRVLPIDHDLVRRCPEFFRALGPRPDEVGRGQGSRRGANP
jgi:hypothetical protein